MYVYIDPDDRQGVISVQRVKKEKFVPGSGCRYKVCNPNKKYNDFFNWVEYHVDTLPQFQDILDKSGKKGNFGGWLIVRMKLRELPVICLGQDEAIFKHYIFTKKIFTHKGKCRLVPKDEGCGIMISDF